MRGAIASDLVDGGSEDEFLASGYPGSGKGFAIPLQAIAARRGILGIGEVGDVPVADPEQVVDEAPRAGGAVADHEGVIIGCATFAVSASRVDAVKFTFDGSEYRSTLDRGSDELGILTAHGHEIQGMSLQSYLFFGSANRLYQQVKALFAARRDTRFLLFDFRLVTGIDSSAIHSFTQIKRASDELGARLVLVNLSPELRRGSTPSSRST